MPDQLKFDFAPVEHAVHKEKEVNIVISPSDLKSHIMALIKLYCVGTCTLESCKDCSANKLRLFLARIAPYDLYVAPLPSNVPLVDAGDDPQGEDQLLLNNLEVITDRLGIRSVYTLDECRRFSELPALETEEPTEVTWE